ncbi:MAG: diaminopimelate epimerase [Gammaproteobacteria bacterium]|nr:diaminopimelate epimerase [Gammaproteobacteria bacterium]
MPIYFSKMHGLGNDFVLIDKISDQNIRLKPEHIKQMADRRRGIGFDQLLIVEPPVTPQIDFFCHIFNADGTEASQCGNGVRCFAKYVVEAGLIFKKNITIETISGVVEAILKEEGSVAVNMGKPKFHPAKIPFLAETQKERYALVVLGEEVEFTPVSIGNPHAVIEVEDVEKAPVEKLGKFFAQHKKFPKGVNVEFMQILDRQHIRLRVYERGTGETLACGTGASAAVATGRIHKRLDPAVQVELRGGTLDIVWEGEDSVIWMTGPASMVYQGHIQL